MGYDWEALSRFPAVIRTCEEARRVAVQIYDPYSWRTMLDIAETYENLARRGDAARIASISAASASYFENGMGAPMAMRSVRGSSVRPLNCSASQAR
jgi:hypothetical protein